MSEAERLINELQDKYFLHEVVDVFTNMNRFCKPFLRVNLHLKNRDLSRTFNYSLKGYKQAVKFIKEYQAINKKCEELGWL